MLGHRSGTPWCPGKHLSVAAGYLSMRGTESGRHGACSGCAVSVSGLEPRQRKLEYEI